MELVLAVDDRLLKRNYEPIGPFFCVLKIDNNIYIVHGRNTRIKV
jgi:hypothetical protein